jgi:hypothetical protein
MKKTFSILVLALSCSAIFAQSSQIATLNHKGQISTFYGANALSQAHDHAINGDVITLSTGSFNGVDITKAITIRGAGIGMDTTNNTLPTIINSNFTINVPVNDTTNLILEGIYHNGSISYSQAKHPMFIKCRFYNFYRQSSHGNIIDATFMHCKFVGDYVILDGSGAIFNSILNYEPEISNFTITNSIILQEYGYITKSTLINCIIGVYDGSLDASNYALNSIGYANGLDGGSYDGEDIFAELPLNSTNKVVHKDSIFATFKTEYDNDMGVIIVPDNEWFKLSNTGKSYLGNDGKEVGIYGGNMPFDPRTTTPQITKCNVAAKSTVDGKISVDIVVSGIE